MKIMKRHQKKIEKKSVKKSIQISQLKTSSDYQQKVYENTKKIDFNSNKEKIIKPKTIKPKKKIFINIMKIIQF
jgi:hypothetical protein